MFLSIVWLLSLCWISNAQPPVPFVPPVAAAIGAIPPPLSPVAPTLYPFGPTPRPLLPTYNNPYYNPTGGPAVPILTYSNEHGLDGTYSYSFTTADGKQVQENGFLKDAYIDNAGEPQGIQVVQGSYAYISPDGTPVQVTYVADENGFRPSGVHIPSDGKPIVPGVLDPRVEGKQILDPYLNRYDPRYRNRLNYNAAYNPLKPYDPRYPYDPKYPYDPQRQNLNPYNQIQSSWINKGEKGDTKKTS